MKSARLASCTNVLACLSALVVIACGNSSGGNPETGGTGGGGTLGGTGGSAPGTGGASAGNGGTSIGSGGTLPGTGGTLPGTGGTSAGTGGTLPGTGGSTAGTGGTGGTLPGTGGSVSGTGGMTSGSGGKIGTGGVAMGGANSGGAPTGGMAGTGARAGAGGSAGSATVTCPTTSTLKAGDNSESIMSGGESRTFIVHIPTGYSASTPAPVILDFHPLGGTGSQQEGSSGWKAKCDSVGCIAVYPDSSKKAGDSSWNAGYCCDNAEKDQIDDVGFARDMIQWLETNACVDPKRIYASGGSNGGGMTYRMACDAADVIAAVAPVDFRCVTGKDPLATAVTAANNTACTCTLPRPIAVVAFDEGADSTIVPYAGGQTPQLATDCPPSGSCVGIGFSSAVVNRDTWAKFDTCTGSAAADPDNSLCQTYSTCASNTSVTLCTTTSGGHLAVYSNSGAKFTDTAWAVLKTQTLP
jgi:polyhydroxybutyrate depolymerase